MNKKRIGILTAILLLTLVLFTGCNNDKGNNLYIGVEGTEMELARAGDASDTAQLTLIKHLYKGLFEYDENGQVQPVLAESFYYSEDGKKIFIKLREDIYWQDGQEISPEDIIQGLRNNMTEAEGAYAYLYHYIDLKNENALDLDEEGQVIISLDKAYTDFEKILAMPIFYPVINNEDLLAGPFSGDYIPEKQAKNKLILVPKEGQEAEAKTGPASINFDFALAQDKMLNSYKDKKYDIVFPKSPLNELKGQKSNFVGGHLLWFNGLNEDLKKLDARKKIAAIIDKSGQVTDYNLAEEALDFILLYEDESLAHAKKIKDQLEKKAGLEINLLPLEAEELYQRLKQGEFDLALEEWQGEHNGKNAYYEYFYNPVHNPLNVSGLNMPSINELYNKINSLADSEERDQLFLQMEAEIKDLLPALLISEGLDKEVYIQRVKKTLVNPVFAYHDYSFTSY